MCEVRDSDKIASLPELLTPTEAVALLRLDELGIKNPTETLRYLRRTKQITYVKVARKVLIPRKAIEDYLKRHTVGSLE